MTVGIIVQTRTGSTRLPGKVMMKADDKLLMVDYVINQLKHSKIHDEIVIATTDLKQDDVMFRCVYPFNRVVVNPYGSVIPCTADFHNMLEIGDAKSNSLLAIWKSDTFKYLRKKHLTDDYEGIFCDKCLNNKVCKSEKLVTAFEKKL